MKDLLVAAATAPFEAYATVYREPEVFPNRLRAGTPLKDLDFIPQLTASHARHSDPLQVADVITGCVNEFCSFNDAGTDSWGRLPERGYQDENFELIAHKVRRGRGRIKGFGFDLFPPDQIGIDTLIGYAETIVHDQIELRSA